MLWRGEEGEGMDIGGPSRDDCVGVVGPDESLAKGTLLSRADTFWDSDVVAIVSFRPLHQAILAVTSSAFSRSTLRVGLSSSWDILLAITDGLPSFLLS